MRVRCPGCGAFVPADDVNVHELVGKCRACEEVFPLKSRGGLEPPARRPPLPRGLTIERGEPPLTTDAGYRERAAPELPELVIVRRWFRWMAVFLTVFLVFWDGFLLAWYASVIAAGGPWMMLVVPLLHVAAGVGLTYYTAALYLNRSTVRVADGVLVVSHGPLPWPGSLTVRTEQLRQLFVRKRVHQRRRAPTVTWELYAETQDMAEIKLLGGLGERAQAAYVEWCVEHHLGILDEPERSDA